MRIPIDQIEEAPKRLAYVEDPATLMTCFGDRPADFCVDRPLEIDLEYYRAGQDVVLQGDVLAQSHGTCARCLERFPARLVVPIRVVFAPPPDASGEADELDEEDAGLAFHDGVEIDVTQMACEQLLLALPTRALCRDDCRGLCPGCGENLNQVACTCDTGRREGPFAALAGLVRARS